MKQFFLFFVIGLLANLLARLIFNYFASGAFAMSGSDFAQGVVVSAIMAVILPKIVTRNA